MHDVGDMVLGTDGQWFIRPPEKCASGHRLKGNCLVSAQPCSCHDRHLSWCCNDCGRVTFGPALGVECDLLHGAARVR